MRRGASHRPGLGRLGRTWETRYAFLPREDWFSSDWHRRLRQRRAQQKSGFAYNRGYHGDTIVKSRMKKLLLALAFATACLNATRADVKKVCMGEVTSNQAISDSSGGAFDSAIGEAEGDCFF